MYHYKATVKKVYDGDTITIDIDLGFNFNFNNFKLRLYGIDTPEMRGEEKEQGKKVRDFVREKILGKEIILHSYKDKKGKYGRYLGDVLYLDENGKQKNLNKELIALGYAVEYYGGKK
jgi:micrococcal nuclease